jgi:tRNA-dihydrouridine synthase C
MIYPKTKPLLYLAPMEGLGDAVFRKTMNVFGGFDFATTEFIRIPKNAQSVVGLVKSYDPQELNDTPLIPQIMGECVETMIDAANALVEKGAKRIDLNCGCPSNTVTGKGAGSSLLRYPNNLSCLIETLVKNVSVPITVKIRTGFEDTSLFLDNIHGISAAGASMLTIHARTRKQGYKLPICWDLIARAKEELQIPVIGNGEIRTLSDAIDMIDQTGCDGLMIGRGVTYNPWIFQQISNHYLGENSDLSKPCYTQVINEFYNQLIGSENTNKLNKLKQFVRFGLVNAIDMDTMRPILRFQGKCIHEYHEFLKTYLSSLVVR